MSDVERARAIANEIRAAWPEKAAEIERAIDDLLTGKRDGLKVTGEIKYKLEKFDGDYVPGMQPVEVIEGVDQL